MFCGKCGTEIKEDDGYCVKCGNKAVKKKEQTEQSVNNWTDLYQSAKKSSKEKREQKRLAKEEEEKYLAKHAENLKTKKVFVHESGQLGYIDDDNNFVPK